MNSTKIQSAELSTTICECAADMLLNDGIGALGAAAVARRADITVGRLSRVYSTQEQLLTGVYAMGYARVDSVCGRHPRAGSPAVDAVIALAYELVEQADADPLARVVHLLESTPYALPSGLPSIYTLWHDRISRVLFWEGEDGPDPMLVDTDYSQVMDVVNVMVSAIAGFCDPRRHHRDSGEVFDRLHLVLMSVMPALSKNKDKADYMRRYLTRVRSSASAVSRSDSV